MVLEPEATRAYDDKISASRKADQEAVSFRDPITGWFRAAELVAVLLVLAEHAFVVRILHSRASGFA